MWGSGDMISGLPVPVIPSAPGVPSPPGGRFADHSEGATNPL